MKRLIAAGDALAAFARDIAEDAVHAPGDIMDGAAHNELAAAWETEVARTTNQQVREFIDYELGVADGCREGADLRDELLQLGATLVMGFAAALQLIGEDPVALDGELEQDEIEQRLAAANGACARIHTLILEDGLQRRLSFGERRAQSDEEPE